MMGFGISTLLMGKVIELLFNTKSIGWSKTYIMLGVVIALVLVISALILKRPEDGVILPQPKANKKASKEDFVARDFKTSQMLRSFTFWRTFVCMAFITAVGNSVISFARDLVLSIDDVPALATTLVGVLAIFNGVGRVLTGALYDILGRRATMISANILTIVAAGITLIAVMNGSLILCVVGLCLTGMSYGSCPTITSAFTASFYGQKYFSVNYSITNFNLIAAAFITLIFTEWIELIRLVQEILQGVQIHAKWQLLVFEGIMLLCASLLVIYLYKIIMPIWNNKVDENMLQDYQEISENICEEKKYFEIFNEIQKLQPKDTLQLILDAQTKEEREFYEIVGNFLLRSRQREVVEKNMF